MRPQKVNDNILIENLFTVIRTKGYDGASLQEFEKASGLKKASLYHRFPGGKKEITQKVLEHVANLMQSSVINIINDDALTPQQKLDIAIDNLANFYKQGEYACLFKVLSSENGFDLFQNYLQSGLLGLLSAFEKLGKQFNLSDQEAKDKATKMMIEIQGSLVVSKILKSTVPFKNSIETIKKLYE